MKHGRPSSAQNLLRIATAFLTGAVLGIAGFALWAEHAGVLMAGPLFNMLLPVGLCAGIFVASLPLLIGQMLAAIRGINASGHKGREMSKSIRAEQCDEPTLPT